MGGYAAGPAVVAARGLGLRTAILNPDAFPGRANRFLAPRVAAVFAQWDVTARYLPDVPGLRAVGCPIRGAFASVTRAAGCAHFGFDAARPLLLVTGASQGARTINQALTQLWPDFCRAHPEWQLLHLTGAADEVATRRAYGAAPVGLRVLPFTHEMPLALAASDAVVARAGASTLAELTALGLPAVLLPYPYLRDKHQHANAQVLADAGAALMLEDQLDAKRNRGPLQAALEQLADPAQRLRMAEAARRLGRPGAARAVAEWLLGDS